MEGLIGSIMLWTSGRLPEGWVPCDGSHLAISEYPELFYLINKTFGGDGVTTFAVPTLNSVPGGNGATVQYLIAVQGEWPDQAT